MVYIKKSKLRKTNKKIKLKSLTASQKLRLKNHRLRHKKDGNPLQLLNKHMKVMRDLMKQGFSFNKSHIEAQQQYPMIRG